MSRVRITLKEFIERLTDKVATKAQVDHFMGKNVFPDVMHKDQPYWGAEVKIKDCFIYIVSNHKGECSLTIASSGKVSPNKLKCLWVKEYIKKEFKAEVKAYIEEQKVLDL